MREGGESVGGCWVEEGGEEIVLGLEMGREVGGEEGEERVVVRGGGERW